MNFADIDLNYDTLKKFELRMFIKNFESNRSTDKRRKRREEE